MSPKLPLFALCLISSQVVYARTPSPQAGDPLDFVYRTVAKVGDPAPSDPGLFFEFFGEAQFEASPPRIDNDGNVYFTAILGSDGDPNTLEGGPNGVYREVDGLLGVVAKLGDPAPGLPGQVFTGFPSNFFGDTPGGYDGRADFSAAAGTASLGNWSDRFGSLELDLLEGQLLPGLIPGQQAVADYALVRRGTGLVAQVRFSTAFADDGLWVNTQGDWEAVAFAGSPAPGVEPGVAFGAGTNLAFFGAVDQWNGNNLGEVVFNGYLTGPGIDVSNDEGIWFGGPETLELIVREGEQVPGEEPGVLWGPANGFQAFGDDDQVFAIANDRGSIFFTGTTRGQDFDNLESTYLRRGDGVFTKLATAFPGANSAGSPAPGLPPEFTFASFVGGRLNNADEVAMIGQAKTIGVSGVGVIGIWRSNADEFELVAASGEPVPGVPEATFNNSFQQGLRISDLTDDGVLFFFGQFSGPGIDGFNNSAIFAQKRTGEISIVARRGDQIDIAGDGSDVRTVFAINLGAGSARDGSRVLELLFLDGSTAVVVAQPELALRADEARLSLTDPTEVHFELDSGPGAAQSAYLLLGSASGTLPGVPLAGVTMPLNPDPLTDLLATLALSGSPLTQSFLGSLDQEGRATATFDIPAQGQPTLAGLRLDFAYLHLGTLDFASNAVGFVFTP